jgi:hypothetical protein
MDVPTAPDKASCSHRDKESFQHTVDSNASTDQSTPAVSIESQLKLRSLYEFVDAGQATLKEIRAHLSLFKSNPGDSASLKRAFMQLNRLCIEVDSWGFDELYKVAHALQRLLMDSEHRTYGRPFWEAFFGGLDMLSALLEQCESNFRWGVAIDEQLACLEPSNLC